MIKKILFLFLICICFMNTQCEDENDDLFIGGCDFTTIVDKSE